MIKIQVNVTDGASQALRSVINSLTGPQGAEINEVAGRAAVNAAIKYHREFDKAGGWRGKRYLGAGRSDGSSFGADVARGWYFKESDKSGAVIANNADHYAFKVRGGTITPKRAKALTIPLIREAAGLYASVYQQNTGHRLFTIKGRNALFERTGQAVTGSRGRRGQAGASTIRTNGIRAVYALVKSVTQRPWPNAVPDEDLLAGAFVSRWKSELAELIAES